mmetsp:Transcript_9785/g.18195  ORF Transcript_9785/g.18195 Transcript_9785/m.18195 type:complete len:83 (+) Transcript_9785:2025-2273(+)
MEWSIPTIKRGTGKTTPGMAESGTRRAGSGVSSCPKPVSPTRSARRDTQVVSVALACLAGMIQGENVTSAGVDGGMPSPPLS